MELCILIPAKNEESTLTQTINKLILSLGPDIKFNILVINDYSTDNTVNILESLCREYSIIDYVNNENDRGVGSAIRYGLDRFIGDVVAICMADGSDYPVDIIKSFNLINNEGYDCVFGSRFIKGGHIHNYPKVKLILNRIFNLSIKYLFFYPYNDFTNIFKVYSRRAIEQITPLESTQFSIGLEMSLYAYKRKLKIAVIPISWIQRDSGVSKLNIVRNIKFYLSTLYKSILNEK